MKKLTKEDVIRNINDKLNTLSNAEFVGFDNEDWKSISEIILIIKCTIHNETKAISYKSFMRSATFSCKKCKGEKIKESKLGLNLSHNDKETKLIKEINEIINQFNTSNKGNISFLGFLDNYNGVNTKLIIKCNIHNITGTPTFYNFKKKGGWMCPNCIKVNVSTRRKITPSQAQKMIYDKYGIDKRYSKIESTYKGYSENVTLICPIHGEYEIKFSTLMSNKNSHTKCNKCLLEHLSITEEQAIERINEKLIRKNKLYNTDISFIKFKNNKWEGNNTKLILLCNKHNNIWETSFNNLMKLTYLGCSHCLADRSKWRSSNIENICYSFILNFLDKFHIKRQKVININNKNIFVDFYIDSINTIIEVDGEQHTKEIPYFHKTYQEFVDQVNRDKYLENYCIENEITLLRIPWIDRKRIPEILKAFFEEGKDITTKVEPKLLPIPYGENIINRS